MSGFYLGLIRTFWLGGIWSGAYIVRPVLERAGFFPVHGIEVMHWLMGAGIVLALLAVTLLCLCERCRWNHRSLQIVITMLALSILYFGLMPWWKLQMILVHAVSALGFLWLLSERKGNNGGAA